MIISTMRSIGNLFFRFLGPFGRIQGPVSAILDLCGAIRGPHWASSLWESMPGIHGCGPISHAG